MPHLLFPKKEVAARILTQKRAIRELMARQFPVLDLTLKTADGLRRPRVVSYLRAKMEPLSQPT